MKYHFWTPFSFIVIRKIIKLFVWDFDELSSILFIFKTELPLLKMKFRNFKISKSFFQRSIVSNSFETSKLKLWWKFHKNLYFKNRNLKFHNFCFIFPNDYTWNFLLEYLLWTLLHLPLFAKSIWFIWNFEKPCSILFILKRVIWKFQRSKV